MDSPKLQIFSKVAGMIAVLAIPVIYKVLYLALRFAPITQQAGNLIALKIRPATNPVVKSNLETLVSENRLRFCEIFFAPALALDSVISKKEVSFREYEVSPLSGLGPRTDLWLFGGHRI